MKIKVAEGVEGRDETGKVAVVSTYFSAGLAVVHFDAQWRISHRDSGLLVCKAENRKHACMILDALNPILDWEQPGEDVQAVGKRKKIKALIKAAINTPAPERKPSETFLQTVLACPQWKGAKVEEEPISGERRIYRVTLGSAVARILGEVIESAPAATEPEAAPVLEPSDEAAPVVHPTRLSLAPPVVPVSIQSATTPAPIDDLKARRSEAARKAWATRRAVAV